MESHSIAVGKVVIIKFHENQDRNNRNTILTRTLGKFGVISTAWYNGKRDDEVPRASEFWKVKIIKEVQVGQRNGCFILEPLEKLPNGAEDVDKLLPGFYTQEYYNSILIIRPKAGLQSHRNKPNWMLPLAIKKELAGVYATIVDLMS